MKRFVVLTLVLGVLGWGQGAEAALFVPFGPQKDVSASTVAGWGWNECFVNTYGTPLGTDASGALSGCSGDYLMLAGRQTGSELYTVLAATTWDVVTTEGPVGTLGFGDPPGIIESNGSRWYNVPNWAWGFAGAGDPVRLNACDNADSAGPRDDDRLCWHLLDFVGGFRAGANVFLNATSDWERVILVGSAAVPEPTTLLLLGTGLAIAGYRRRRKH